MFPRVTDLFTTNCYSVLLYLRQSSDSILQYGVSERGKSFSSRSLVLDLDGVRKAHVNVAYMYFEVKRSDQGKSLCSTLSTCCHVEAVLLYTSREELLSRKISM